MFTDLDEKLRLLLETVVPTNVVSLPLTHVRNTIYATAIDQDKYLTNTRMYLAVAADTTDETIIRSVPQLVKTCSATQIEQLISSAVPGIGLSHVAHPPAGIPIKVKYQYFSLNQSGAAWETVPRARNFAAHIPAEIPNPRMELIILLPQTGGAA